MSARLPAAAQQAFEQGSVCYVAVQTPWGPHLTPVVYAVHAGRIWLTTSRGSVKAKAWRRSPWVAGLVPGPEGAVSFRGDVRTYDALDPTSWPGAVLAGPRLLEAATRFTLKNARFFAGYAADARRVPLAWAPPGRVFGALRPLSGRILKGAQAVGEWGPWPSGSRYRRTLEPLRHRTPLDLRVPGDVREAVRASGEGALALEGPDGSVVLPVSWGRVEAEGIYEAVLGGSALELAGTGPEARAALTIDHTSRWRASEMTGMLLQGDATLHHPGATTRGRRALLERLDGNDELALVRLRPDRIVWWRGWSSGAVATQARGRRDRVGSMPRTGSNGIPAGRP